MSQTEEERKKKKQETARTTTVGTAVGDTADAVADIFIIDSLVDLAGDIISGIMD